MCEVIFSGMFCAFRVSYKGSTYTDYISNLLLTHVPIISKLSDKVDHILINSRYPFVGFHY